jgi:hypothetical protein
MTKEEVWNEYHTSKWIAENGLGRLDPYPESKLDGGAYDGQMECVWNENGVLFRGIFGAVSNIAGIDLADEDDKMQVVIKRLESRTQPGTYNRRPYWDMPSPRHEAHDNYIVIAASARWRAEQVCFYSLKHGGNFNNVDGSWLLKQQRQGGEIAYYATMAEFVPMLTDWIWLLVGILVGAFNKAASETQLSWIRLYYLNKANLQTNWQRISLFVVSFLWKVIKAKRIGYLEDIFKLYYKPGHPTIRMASFCGKDFGF